jgi:hypothetical protein
MCCKDLGDIWFVHAEQMSLYVLNTACSYCSFKLNAVIFCILFQNWSTHWNRLSYSVFATVVKGMILFQCFLCLHQAKISRCSIVTSQHVDNCGTLLRSVFSFLRWKQLFVKMTLFTLWKFQYFYNPWKEKLSGNTVCLFIIYYQHDTMNCMLDCLKTRCSHCVPITRTCNAYLQWHCDGVQKIYYFSNGGSVHYVYINLLKWYGSDHHKRDLNSKAQWHFAWYHVGKDYRRSN